MAWALVVWHHPAMRAKGALVVVLAAVATVLGAFSSPAQAAVQCPPEVAFESWPGRTPPGAVRSFRGTATGSEPVVVQIYRGLHAGGQPEATLEAPVSEGKWATPDLKSPLPEGTHTVLATEACEGGEEGKSAAVTFISGWPGPWVRIEAVPVRSADATPVFRGITTEDETPVTVHIYKGDRTEGLPVATAEAQPHNDQWATEPISPPLNPGEYTAVATQGSIYEPEDRSSEVVTFLIEAPWSAVGFQALLEDDGSGRIFLGSEGEWSWQACNEQEVECSPFGTGEEISTGTAAPGTVFLAKEPAMHELAKSPIWHGDAEPLTPPTRNGEIRANTTIKFISATWKGGWAHDFDIPLVAACETADGTGCTALTDWPFYGCPRGFAFIDPAFSGYYLGVADHLYGPGTQFAAYAVASPYGPVSLKPGPTSSVAVLGRIEPATGPAEGSCAAPPLQPAVTLDVVPTPSEDQTPSFSGTTSYASTRPVIVQVFAGSKPEGTPLATVEAQPEAAKWQSAPLAEHLSHGTYTAIASEQSSFGNAEGKSSPVTFQVQESVKEYLENREGAEPLFTITGTSPNAIVPPPADVQFEKEFWERFEREKREREQAEPRVTSGTVSGTKTKSGPPRFYVLKHPKKEHCKAHYVRTHEYGIKQYVHGYWVTEHPTVCLHVAAKR